MCWRHRAWTPTAAMWPCPGTATAWTCITAATILPVRTSSSTPYRVTGPRTWRRTTARRRIMPNGAGDYSGYRSARAEMGNMVAGLERDPQLESLLEGRKRDLGISFESGMGIGRDLV